MIYALIQNNKIINITEWDGDTSKWTPPSDCIAISIDGLEFGIGDTYDPTSQTFSKTPIPPPVYTEQDYANAIQKHIDATAQDRQYSDGISLASYDSSTNPTWAAEAQTFIAWRDQVWIYAFTELEKVKNGTRPQPSIEELLAELPSITWPQ